MYVTALIFIVYVRIADGVDIDIMVGSIREQDTFPIKVEYYNELTNKVQATFNVRMHSSVTFDMIGDEIMENLGNHSYIKQKIKWVNWTNRLQTTN